MHDESPSSGVSRTQCACLSRNRIEARNQITSFRWDQDLGKGIGRTTHLPRRASPNCGYNALAVPSPSHHSTASPALGDLGPWCLGPSTRGCRGRPFEPEIQQVFLILGPQRFGPETLNPTEPQTLNINILCLFKPCGGISDARMATPEGPSSSPLPFSWASLGLPGPPWASVACRRSAAFVREVARERAVLVANGRLVL